MNKSIAQLTQECLNRNIYIYKNMSKKELLKILALYAYNKINKPSWALTKRLEFEPMLCYPFKHLHKQEKINILSSNDWLAENKWNGNRQIIFYHPNEGFNFYSRNISVKDFLPVCYTSKVLMHNNNNELVTPDFFIGKYHKAFIIDSEVVVENNNLCTSNSKINSKLNAVSAIMNMNAKEAHHIQKTQSNLKFMCFDMLYLDEFITRIPLLTRRAKLNITVHYLNCFTTKALYETIYYINDKEMYYEKVIHDGGEGIVLKNIHSQYITTGSRKRTTQIKLKNSMKEANGMDIDVFITGAKAGTIGSAFESLIGSIEVSVFLQDNQGNEIEHIIGQVSGIPAQLRKKLTGYDDNLNPVLDNLYLNEVITINGQSITAKNKKFAHCVVDNWDNAFRLDKTKYDCILKKSFIKDQIR